MNPKTLSRVLTTFLAAIVALSCFAFAPTAAAAIDVNLLMSHPGEDAATTIRISWHSSSSSCVLKYMPASQSDFSNAQTASVSQTGFTYAFSGSPSSYKHYTAKIQNLTPGTRYAYRVEIGSSHTSTHYFKTAEQDNSFNFLWFGDIHMDKDSSGYMTKMNNTITRAENLTASRGGIDLIIFSGDAVKYGQRYTDWLAWNEVPAIKNYSFALIPGNKEYYNTGHSRETNKWFRAATNVPYNGVDNSYLKSSCYWFIYNNVLFFGLDDQADSTSGVPKLPDGKKYIDLQVEWMDQVARAQSGKYQYIVVYEHISTFKRDGIYQYSRFDNMYETLTDLNVDFALSGDSHSYVRSLPLNGRTPTTTSASATVTSGVVYIVCPMISSSSSPDIRYNTSSRVAAADANGASYGGCYFTVDSEYMNFYYLDPSGNVADTVKVKAKRSPVNFGGSGGSGSNPGGDGYVLYQDFTVMPNVSSTPGDTTHGTWSTAYSSSMSAYHATLSQYTNSSSGNSSMKVEVTAGRYTVDLYLGCTGASSSSELSFKVWVPSGSNVGRIEKITVGDTQVLGQTALTDNAWNYITTGPFGSAAGGVIRIQFYNSGGGSGQSVYIDDVAVTGAPQVLLYQDFDVMPPVSSTIGNTTHGTWSVEYSSSMSVYHATLSRYYNSSTDNASMKVDITSGRYTADLYLGFQGASPSSYLTFKVWIPAGSAVDRIEQISVGGVQLLGETALTANAWNLITTGAFGAASSGALRIRFHNAGGASGSDIYIDDVTITGGGSRLLNVGYMSYYNNNNYNDIDYDALSHICLAFFNPYSDSDLSIRNRFSSSRLSAIISKAQTKGVRLLLSTGGASGSDVYKSILSSSTKRNQVAANLVNYAYNLGLDGIDVDIEASKSAVEIWDYYSSFITKLKELCDEKGMILSTACADWYADKISTSTLNKFEFIGIMAYAGSAPDHSPYSEATKQLNYFNVTRGIDASKLLVGVPFYGKSASSSGDIDYREILAMYPDAWMYDYIGGIGYNGEAMIARKCNLSKSYGGTMIWELGGDATGSGHALLDVMRATLYGTGTAPRY